MQLTKLAQLGEKKSHPPTGLLPQCGHAPLSPAMSSARAAVYDLQLVLPWHGRHHVGETLGKRHQAQCAQRKAVNGHRLGTPLIHICMNYTVIWCYFAWNCCNSDTSWTGRNIVLNSWQFEISPDPQELMECWSIPSGTRIFGRSLPTRTLPKRSTCEALHAASASVTGRRAWSDCGKSSASVCRFQEKERNPSLSISNLTCLCLLGNSVERLPVKHIHVPSCCGTIQSVKVQLRGFLMFLILYQAAAMASTKMPKFSNSMAIYANDSIYTFLFDVILCLFDETSRHVPFKVRIKSTSH